RSEMCIRDRAWTLSVAVAAAVAAALGVDRLLRRPLDGATADDASGGPRTVARPSGVGGASS
uniref:hypothetical protein n=1 Tax=Streptomyces sp. rh254 TaxID=3028730 RepID=UPI003C7D9CB0